MCWQTQSYLLPLRSVINLAPTAWHRVSDTDSSPYSRVLTVIILDLCLCLIYHMSVCIVYSSCLTQKSGRHLSGKSHLGKIRTFSVYKETHSLWLQNNLIERFAVVKVFWISFFLNMTSAWLREVKAGKLVLIPCTYVLWSTDSSNRETQTFTPVSSFLLENLINQTCTCEEGGWFTVYGWQKLLSSTKKRYRENTLTNIPESMLMSEMLSAVTCTDYFRTK